MLKRNLLMVTAIVVALSTSCKKDNNLLPGYGEQGAFIVNEGSMNANNGSISYYNPETGCLLNGIFETVNERPLGDVIQSISIAGNKAYIVVNASGKVEIVKLADFKTTSEPIIASYPRYLLAVNDRKAYLSNGSEQGNLYCIDLEKDIITDSIQVGYGPETMVLLNDKVYVANSGGWGFDSTISIVNTHTDEIEGNIVAGDVPTDMVLDRDNNLWVYCKGYALYDWNTFELISETETKLVKINTATNTVSAEYIIGVAGDYSATPAKIAINGDGNMLYYTRPDGIYKLSVSSPEIQAAPFVTGNYYGLEVNPQSNDLYLFQSSFTGNGNMIIVDAETGDQSTYVVGIGPNGVIFNLE